jgi:hypothetical protein
MISSQKEAVQEMKSWPKGLIDIYKINSRLCQKLMKEHGVSADVAQKTLIEFMKEYESELTSGKYTTVKNALLNQFDN